ncbi:MAG TPA: hypothetical protein VG273_05620 [Bryobacteraceae bacterium]|jgi:hypothetical protein|nr:hypothetical protein [Bryobacteraceae bacterium]
MTRSDPARESRYSVPKQELIAVLQIALENGRLRVPRKLKEAGALAREMINIQVTPGAGTGRARIGADGYGEHDDLVMALALACWRAGRPQNHFGEARLPGF